MVKTDIELLKSMLIKKENMKTNNGSLKIENTSEGLRAILKTIETQIIQETREGYNKVDLNTYILKNCTLNEKTDTYIKATASSLTNDSGVMFGPFTLKTDTTYTFKALSELNGGDAGYGSVELYKNDTTTWYKSLGIIEKTTFTVDEDLEYYVRLLVSRKDTGTILNTVTFSNIIIYEDAEDKEYEQYGISPSFNFPSPVKHVGGSVYNIAKASKNLAKFSSSENSINISGRYELDEKVLNYVKVIANEAYQENVSCGFRILDLTNYAGKTITISAKVKSSGSNKGFFVVRQNSYEWVNDNKTNEKFEEAQNTIDGIISFPYAVASKIDDSNRYLHMFVYARRNTAGNIGDYVEYYVQIEDNETQTEIITHQQQNYPLDLTNYPIYKGNICKEGDEYFTYDTYRKYKFTGSDIWSILTNKNGLTYFQTIIDDVKVGGSVKCNVLEEGDTWNATGGNLIQVSPNSTRINILVDDITDTDTLNEKLNGNYIVYETANPTKIKITDEIVISQLDSILLGLQEYEDITYLNCDQQLILELVVEKDKMKILEQESIDLKQLVLENGG